MPLRGGPGISGEMVGRANLIPVMGKVGLYGTHLSWPGRREARFSRKIKAFLSLGVPQVSVFLMGSLPILYPHQKTFLDILC